eukprot:TRINITY_DN104481_c0_g1_i1.p1 TRINITY_DN104481_c0_g1~~TRINITY_DN104481_c0_g1_i1.p1  ORF type:complete len:356 (+),score=120.31 TRINITY_DN104481_c0_g1_i1:62-1069(+)
MADRQNELKAERETSALKKLQAAAGLMERKDVERLDWMYEQSTGVKQNEDELMNKPVEGQKDKDLEDMKNLNGLSGSLFLKNSTKTTEDMLRKLREDPLFQIRRQEQAAKANMMANPLIMAKLQKKEQKEAKKALKKAKKAAKKEKKAMKKAAGGKSKKKKSSSSSSSDDSSASEQKPAKLPPQAQASSRSRRQEEESQSKRPREKNLSSLGPSSIVLSQREERAQRVAEQKEAALASRGLGSRLTEEEKDRRVEQMRMDAKKHERIKDQRMKSAEEREKQIEELEAKMRANSDQQYFRDIRREAYAGNEDSVADRLKSQRHRRQKHINDPLEKD